MEIAVFVASIPVMAEKRENGYLLVSPVEAHTKEDRPFDEGSFVAAFDDDRATAFEAEEPPFPGGSFIDHVLAYLQLAHSSSPSDRGFVHPGMTQIPLR